VVYVRTGTIRSRRRTRR